MLLRILIFTLLLTMTIFSQTPPIEPGVSQTLAKWRAANYSDVRYKLNLTLEKGAPLMKGTIEIRVNLSETGAKNDLVLDWRTTQFQNDKDKPFADVVAVNATGAPAARLPEREARKETPQFQLISNESETSVRLLRNLASEPLALQSSEPLALQSNEHLIIPSKFLKTGENFIKIEFASPIKASGAAITRYLDKEDGAEYVYSLFVPSDASTAFPVFDQPDLKARFKLNAVVPEGWKMVSNMKGKWFTCDGCDGDYVPNSPIYWFEETKPISTYVFAFAAGEFAEVSEPSAVADGLTRTSEKLNKNSNTSNAKLQPPATADGSDLPTKADLSTKIYVRKSQAEKFKAHAAETFRLNRESVKFFESYFDYKFPFPKYDLVLIPEFPFGGMEHAGATFLRESSIIFPQTPTKNDYVSRANLLFHEAAHQWFGDLVTMRWFDDLWLKEGFATFIGYKALEKLMPEYNAWKIFYERSKQSAYLTDATRGTTPIYQEIPNLSAAKSAYGNIVYSKAPSFLKQAEFYLGEKEFQTAVRAFLKKYEFKNATWEDLVKEFEIAGKKNLKDWASVWVTERGLPIINSDREQLSVYVNKLGDGHEANIVLFIRQKNIYGETGIWKQKLKVLTLNPKGIRHVKDVPLIHGRATIEEINFDEVKEKEPKFIFPNYQDYGYGIFLLDEKSRAYVLENIQHEKDDFLRTMMWGALWDSVREAELDPKIYVELVIKNLSVESDESTIQTLLSRTATAMNYYLSVPPAVAGGLTRSAPDASKKPNSSNAKLQPSATADGSDLAGRLENLLIEKMHAAPTLGQRITFYRAFLHVSSSENARNVLKDVLSGKIKIQDLTLKTKDKFDIVTRLLILGETDAPALLAELEKSETSDEAKRYAYAAKAGIASTENKAKFWNDFVNNKELSESWIESAFVPFNSVRHSDLTLPYLEKALAELPALKSSRKIFFINGWLAAFIGGQRSEEALKVVNKFLADNPNLDKDLRLKILENVDALERAVRIREKYGK